MFKMTLLSSLLLSSILSAETIALDVVSYDDFINESPAALHTLEKALHEKGIAGIKGIPGFKEKSLEFIAKARAFSALPEEIKEPYAPDRLKGEIAGYERGKEKFRTLEGTWIVDESKVSYYGFIPDSPANKWPLEVALQNSFQSLGLLMSEVGEELMKKMGQLGSRTGISLRDTPRLGRMLHYQANSSENPLWCGAHYDHSMLTALIPGFYFSAGEAIAEPEEAGLFVKAAKENIFKKVEANDPDVMMFQVGEFGQLATNDAIKATEHKVVKAHESVERYAMALFFDAPMDTVIHSTSLLTQDERYGGASGDPCSYSHWSAESYKRYLVQSTQETQENLAR